MSTIEQTSHSVVATTFKERVALLAADGLLQHAISCGEVLAASRLAADTLQVQSLDERNPAWPLIIAPQRASAKANCSTHLYAGAPTFAFVEATAYAEEQTGLKRNGNDWIDLSTSRSVREGKDKVVRVDEYLLAIRIKQASIAAERVGFSAVSSAGFVACTPDGNVIRGACEESSNIEEILATSGYVSLAPEAPQAAEIIAYLDHLD